MLTLLLLAFFDISSKSAKVKSTKVLIAITLLNDISNQTRSAKYLFFIPYIYTAARALFLRAWRDSNSLEAIPRKLNPTKGVSLTSSLPAAPELEVGPTLVRGLLGRAVVV